MAIPVAKSFGLTVITNGNGASEERVKKLGAGLDRITEIFKDTHLEASVDEMFSLDDVNWAMKKVASGGSKGKTILKIS